MSRFDSCRKNVVVVLCGLTFLIVALSPAFAEGKLNAVYSDQSTCPAILLTNEDYFPALLKAIDEAQSEIFMSIFSFKAGVHKNSYPDIILAHLARAVKKGIKVIVILENTGGNDYKLDAENQQTKKLLEEKGVKVYFDSPRQTTHTKLIVIDERMILLGSHNLTQAALKYNNEISILLDRPDLAKRARNYMLKIIKEAK
ncbi:MAG: phospholipase D-like domain-containing protein [Smithella sp.]|jgi:phosphatidylserine/phosphatidylglycerophosphate/cardiolipin synthase-like enzyme